MSHKYEQTRLKFDDVSGIIQQDSRGTHQEAETVCAKPDPEEDATAWVGPESAQEVVTVLAGPDPEENLQGDLVGYINQLPEKDLQSISTILTKQKAEKCVIGETYQVATAILTIHDKNPRRQINEKPMAELTESVRELGVIFPISVVFEDAEVRVVDGGRRLQAAVNAGLETIPCSFVRADPAIIALLCQLQTDSLTIWEEYLALNALKTDLGLTDAQLAQKVHKSPAAICQIMSLKKLELATLQSVADLPKSMIFMIATLPTQADMMQMAEDYRAGMVNTSTSPKQSREVKRPGHKAEVDYTVKALSRMNNWVAGLLPSSLPTSKRDQLIQLRDAINRLFPEIADADMQ